MGRVRRRGRQGPCPVRRPQTRASVRAAPARTLAVSEPWASSPQTLRLGLLPHVHPPPSLPPRLRTPPRDAGSATRLCWDGHRAQGEREPSRPAAAYDGQQLRVEEELRVGHAHGQDQLALEGALVHRDVRPAEQHAALQQAVHVHGQHLHGVRQNELERKELFQTCLALPATPAQHPALSASQRLAGSEAGVRPDECGQGVASPGESLSAALLRPGVTRSKSTPLWMVWTKETLDSIVKYWNSFKNFSIDNCFLQVNYGRTPSLSLHSLKITPSPAILSLSLMVSFSILLLLTVCNPCVLRIG